MVVQDSLSSYCEYQKHILPYFLGWGEGGGGWMVLDIFQWRCILLIWIIVKKWPTELAVGADGQLFRYFFSRL